MYTVHCVPIYSLISPPPPSIYHPPLVAESAIDSHAAPHSPRRTGDAGRNLP